METGMTQLHTTSYHISFRTAFGFMRPVSNGTHLIRLDWDQKPFEQPNHEDDVSRETMRQLQAYLAGELRLFNLPICPEGKSAKGISWLETMARIPYGKTLTYAEYAAAAGKPKASRAAGSACSQNPIPIIYPCHRVVRADGSLGNYGGGSALHPTHPDNLERKRGLINLEQTNLHS